MTEEKRKSGRASGRKGKDVRVYLSDEVLAKAREIGEGSASKGIRIAVLAYQEPSIEEIYSRIIRERDQLIKKEK